jgi:hypothetical protein
VTMRPKRLISSFDAAGTWLAGLATAALLLGGCNAYRLDPPTGFAQVDRDASGVRMKGSDEVGLNLRVYDNVEGGTLAYWSEDLVRKLAKRGYRLEKQSPVTSDNGVVGTRFDFAYASPGDDTPKFFTALLFVTDKYKVIVQVAGDAEHHPRIARQVDQIAAATKVRGCKVGKPTCKGPQPPPISHPTTETATVAPARDEADG